jgi:hypothetical protein
MARSVLTQVLMALLLASGLTGCADAPMVEVSAPLLVFNSYPANGATVDARDLTELAWTFSVDLGEADHARRQAAQHASLFGPDGLIELVRPDATNVAYEPGTLTIRVVLDQTIRAALPAGRYDLVLAAGVQTEGGLGMPTDFTVRFRLTRPE